MIEAYIAEDVEDRDDSGDRVVPGPAYMLVVGIKDIASKLIITKL